MKEGSERCDMKTGPAIAGAEEKGQGPGAKEYKGLLEAEKGQVTFQSPLEPLGRNTAPPTP